MGCKSPAPPLGRSAKLHAAKIKSAVRFLNAAMAEALAELDGCGEALTSKLTLAEPQVGQTPEVETVSLSPGILTDRPFRTVQRIASILESFIRVASRKKSFGEDEA